MATFRNCVETQVARSRIVDNGFMDHDKENMALRVNSQYKYECGNDPKNIVDNMFGKTVEEFGVKLFDACVYYCVDDKGCLT
jgi:hypothetical protein